MSEWCQLPADILVPILFVTERGALTFTNSDDGNLRLAKDIRSTYKHFHKLRLVCKHFNQVFQANHKLSARLFVHETVGCAPTFTFTTRLRAHLPFISTLVAQRSGKGSPAPGAEMARGPFSQKFPPGFHVPAVTSGQTDPSLSLEGFLQHASSQACEMSLKTVIIFSPTPLAVRSLAWFECISSCTLDYSHTPNSGADLKPLLFLPKLATLQLQHGKFSNVDMLPHLMSLKLVGVFASCGAQSRFQHNLNTLFLAKSVLGERAPEGIAAYSNLQSLTCHDSGIGMGEESDMYLEVSDKLSYLTQLTRLVVHMCYISDYEDMDWLYNLTNLQILKLRSLSGKSPCQIP